MRILELIAENVKKLSVVEIKPTGDLVHVTGPNASGKSSVLDSIWWALAGAEHIQALPIKKGQDKARIRLNLGDIIVTRRFTQKGSTLSVENAEGLTYKSPQKMLDDLIGALSFDPLEFTRMDPKRQVEALRAVVKLDVDLDKLDGLNRTSFDKRTDVNRETRRLQAQLASLPAPPDKLPDEPIDTAAIVTEIGSVGKHNADIERAKESRAALQISIDGRRQSATACRNRAAELRRQAEAADAEADKHETAASEDQRRLDGAPALPEPKDAAALEDKLREAGATNTWIARRTERQNLEKAIKASEAAAAALTTEMDERTKQKTDAIGAAKMPVDGLGFGDGAIVLNGIPFDQASSAEQLRVSCALAMAANPKLRVLRIKDGSLLDDKGLQLLTELAAANDYQIWLEAVRSDAPAKIVMEDGRVALAAGQLALEGAAE